MSLFHKILANTLASAVVNTFVWFAVTFWAYLETRSVIVTSVMAGIYTISVALSGFGLGSIVDRSRRKTSMLASCIASLGLYLAAAAIYASHPPEAFQTVESLALWAFIVLTLCGAIAGNLRAIALLTVVSILVPVEQRDRANGFVGTANGIAFLVASVFSGMAVAYLGVGRMLAVAIGLTVLVLVHLLRLPVPDTPLVDDAAPLDELALAADDPIAVAGADPTSSDVADVTRADVAHAEPEPIVVAGAIAAARGLVLPELRVGAGAEAEAEAEAKSRGDADAPVSAGVDGHAGIGDRGGVDGRGDGGNGGGGLDLPGTIRAVRAVPGLFGLVFFQTFNNLLGGIYMALMDAYGLMLMTVQEWGFLWGVLSLAFIFGGLAVSRFGLGSSPLRSLFLANIVMWLACIAFPLRASVLLLAVGMFVWLCLAPVVEAAEQTILQRVVPLERQGRVFGFAQSVEQAASPVMAFMIGPIAQIVFIPFMTTGAGVALLGPSFGTGPDRGLGLLFVVAGLVGLVITLVAMRSRSYRILAAHHAAAG